MAAGDTDDEIRRILAFMAKGWRVILCDHRNGLRFGSCDLLPLVLDVPKPPNVAIAYAMRAEGLIEQIDVPEAVDFEAYALTAEGRRIALTRATTRAHAQQNVVDLRAERILKQAEERIVRGYYAFLEAERRFKEMQARVLKKRERNLSTDLVEELLGHMFLSLIERRRLLALSQQCCAHCRPQSRAV